MRTRGAVSRKEPGTLWSQECVAAQRRIVAGYLAQYCGNKSATARALGLDRANFRRLLRALDIAGAVDTP